MTCLLAEAGGMEAVRSDNDEQEPRVSNRARLADAPRATFVRRASWCAGTRDVTRADGMNHNARVPS